MVFMMTTPYAGRSMLDNNPRIHLDFLSFTYLINLLRVFSRGDAIAALARRSGVDGLFVHIFQVVGRGCFAAQWIDRSS